MYFYNNETVLIVPGIVLDTFAGEAAEGKRGEEEMTGSYFY